MTREKFSKFDVADYLKSEADIAAYLEAAAESGDAGEFAGALGDVARARNMSELARDSGLSREGLYKALSKDGKPSLDTTLRVLTSLGMRVSIQPVAKRKPVARKKAAAAR
jgi:probable addiction module antidote protein